MTITNLLDKLSIKTILVKPDNLTQLDALRKSGFQSFPVVQILKDGQKVDEWNDFQVDKIKEWKNKLWKHIR